MRTSERPPSLEHAIELPHLNDIIWLGNEEGRVITQIGNKIRVRFGEREKLEELSFVKTHVKVDSKIYYVVKEELVQDQKYGIIKRYRLFRR